MGLSEFDLIRRFFSHCGVVRDDVPLGVGDDCALLSCPAGQDLAVTTDTLVAGVHFAADADASAIGRKALAVNLSDLAAMGAEPAWVTLALTLPTADAAWLAGFSSGFCGLAEEYGAQLVGGDTTRGPLAVTVQAAGFVPAGAALRRSGARPGDLLYLTGTLGDAGLALLVQQGLYVRPQWLRGLRSRLERPTPRIAAGRALRGVATAAIDVSDGLSADLGHVLEASGVGATVYVDRLPLGPAVGEYLAETGDWGLPLSAGDDYELCFAVPGQRQGEAEALGAALDGGLTWIGMIESTPGLRYLLPDGQTLAALPGGYDHFRGDA